MFAEAFWEYLSDFLEENLKSKTLILDMLSWVTFRFVCVERARAGVVTTKPFIFQLNS